MQEYQLSSKQIFSILMEKKVEFLYHANTALTSLTFIRERALLSRYYIEANKLGQSPQKSDPEDIKFDVWDHVFLDAIDLHSKYKRANKYGPIVFRIKLEMLMSPMIQSIFVTRSNPWYWKDDTPLNKRYYSSVEELREDYLTGKKLDSQIMFTIRNPEKVIKLNKFLDSICLDEPKLLIRLSNQEGEKNLGDYIRSIFIEALNENGLGHLSLLKRHESRLNTCTCMYNYSYLYNYDRKEFQRRFKPTV